MRREFYLDRMETSQPVRDELLRKLATPTNSNRVSLHKYAFWLSTLYSDPGPRLNIKTVLSTYGDFHVKDKTAVRTSYL